MSVSKPSFVHLHVHTQYSLLDGAIRLAPLFDRVSAFGMDSVAITDHGTMFGVVEFYQAALKAGIRPVIGCEFYVAPRKLTDKTSQDAKGIFHLVALARNQEGYKNLCRLATIAQLEGFYYKPRIDREVLKAHSKGLIGLSACLHGEIPLLIKDGLMNQAKEAARFYTDVFGEGNFYLEVQNNGIALQETINQGLFEIGRDMSIPLVATNDCHYLDKEDARAHEVLLCVQTGKTVHDKDRFRFDTDQLYFKPPEEMAEYFADYPGAVENTVDIARRCQVDFDFDAYHFPRFETAKGVTPEEQFEKQSREGFEKVFEICRVNNPDINRKDYEARLDYEIETIQAMGFSGYFLIVADFIRYAKQNGIPVGPGRGSAAGSLVAFSLGITDLDPLEHGLIFERFLNPSRISMPDIDVDFCINGREAVFKYVVQKYGGNDYVAQIITFGKMKTRAVIRDVGRALDIPLREVDTIAKMVPDVLNIKLEDALKQEPKIEQMAKDRSDIRELLKICKTLEGLPRHASTHAAGVVIGDRPLYEYMPLYKGKRDEVVTQYDMKIVEKIGLVKFDFLGLRNLTVIADTLSLIQAQGKTPPDMSTLDFNDEKTYRLLSSGDTTGVFQLESSGMKELLVKMKPASFDDVTALVALYRPGPLDSGMVDDFVERKHGRKEVEYLVPELEEILKETYGVIVYQEQVMKIAGVLANYTMAEADGLRKAMGKKIKEMLAKHHERFVSGATENRIPGKKAEQIFELMEKFGGYGFNKSHSAAYALIAYQTAYLKAHYPVEFIASLLTSEMDSSDGVVKLIAECKSHNIPLYPPDVNESVKEFTVSDGGIRFGLLAVKNVGEGAIESIIEARQSERFESLFDFCERVDGKKVNKRVLESLIKCGAFDSTGEHRSRMIAGLEIAMEYGQRVQKEKSNPQLCLFDMGDNKQRINMPVLPEIEEWDEKKRLGMEKEALGFYVSGHPLQGFEELIHKYTDIDTLRLKDKNDGETVRLGGMVSAIKIIKTRKGKDMAFVNVEDLKGNVEVTLFSSVYESAYSFLEEDFPVFVQGKLQKDENSVKILADTVIPLARAEDEWTAEIRINLDVTRTDREKLDRLKTILEKHPGSCQVYIHIKNPDVYETVIELPDSVRLKPGSLLKSEVDGFLGYDALQTVCKPVTS